MATAVKVQSKSGPVCPQTNLMYWPDEVRIAGCKLLRLKPGISLNAELTTESTDPNTWTAILVTDKRITIQTSSNSCTTREDQVAVEQGSGGCCALFSCCFTPRSSSKVAVGTTARKVVTERTYQVADLKDVDFEMFEQSESVRTVEVNAGGCCKPEPVVKMSKAMPAAASIMNLRITLSFVKKVADFVPGWQVDDGTKTCYKVEVLEGRVHHDAAAELHASLMLNDALMRPSLPGATAITLPAVSHAAEGAAKGGRLLGGGMGVMGGGGSRAAVPAAAGPGTGTAVPAAADGNA